jgi:hypothetical protein
MVLSKPSLEIKTELLEMENMAKRLIGNHITFTFG